MLRYNLEFSFLPIKICSILFELFSEWRQYCGMDVGGRTSSLCGHFRVDAAGEAVVCDNGTYLFFQKFDPDTGQISLQVGLEVQTMDGMRGHITSVNGEQGVIMLTFHFVFPAEILRHFLMTIPPAL